MSFLSRLLGHDVPRQPYLCAVTYPEARDTFPFFAKDMREALDLTIKLMPTRDETPTRIEIVLAKS